MAPILLGRTTSGTLTLASDATGLQARIAPPDTSYARDLLASVARHDTRSVSFSFKALAVEWHQDPDDGELVRVVTDLTRWPRGFIWIGSAAAWSVGGWSRTPRRKPMRRSTS